MSPRLLLVFQDNLFHLFLLKLQLPELLKHVQRFCTVISKRLTFALLVERIRLHND
jgi:hypothetical protein